MQRWQLWLCMLTVGVSIFLIKWLAEGDFGPTKGPGPMDSSWRELPPLPVNRPAGGPPVDWAQADSALQPQPLDPDRWDAEDRRLAELVADERALRHGAEFYELYCFECHGGTSPSLYNDPEYLFDNRWRYGARPTEIFKVIRDGLPEFAMGTMVGILDDEETAALTAYLLANQRNFHPED